MTKITRDEIKNLVGVFYHPTFKTFYVNSVDGNTFVHQTGVFISFGLTTSMKVLENMREILNTHKGYRAVIAEISSKKIAGQFLNTVTKTKDIEQYMITDFGDDIMDREASIKELEELKKYMNLSENLEVLKEVTPKISKLSNLISKLDKQESWDSHLIQKDSKEDYRIFHKLVNYKQEDNIEYRIGIYVTES